MDKKPPPPHTHRRGFWKTEIDPSPAQNDPFLSISVAFASHSAWKSQGRLRRTRGDHFEVSNFHFQKIQNPRQPHFKKRGRDVPADPILSIVGSKIAAGANQKCDCFALDSRVAMSTTIASSRSPNAGPGSVPGIPRIPVRLYGALISQAHSAKSFLKSFPGQKVQTLVQEWY